MSVGWVPPVAECAACVGVIESCFAGPLSESVVYVVRASVWTVAVVVGCAVNGIDHYT